MTDKESQAIGTAIIAMQMLVIAYDAETIEFNGLDIREAVNILKEMKQKANKESAL